MKETPPNPYRPNPLMSPEEAAAAEENPVVRPLWSLAMWHLLVLITASKLFFVVIPICVSVASKSDQSISLLTSAIVDQQPIVLLGIFFVAQLAAFLFCISRESLDSDPYQDIVRRRWTIVVLAGILLAIFAVVVVPPWISSAA